MPSAWVVGLVAAALFGALLWHNRAAAGRWGFDLGGHLDYVREIAEHGRLPLADEGWESYQPPLFYLAAAGLLRIAGRTIGEPADPGAVALLTLLGGLAAAAQCGLVWASLRRLFPERPRRAVLGTLLAALLPAQLYLSQYITNESWVALWSTAALALALGLLARPGATAWAFLGLGGVLGLALLSKFSALLTLVAVLTVLAGRLAVQRERAAAPWLKSVGLVVVGCLLICGWHYARVTARFGRPLVGNWDRDLGFSWWQDPGYHTAGDLTRFGRSLTAPVWSAFHSIPDALYSTLWGDGLLGGAAVLAAHPPWDLELMAAGALLALLPTLGLLVGFGAALARLVRRPTAEWFLLLGVAGATGYAVVAMCLRLPFYAQAKAFYALSALVPLAAIGGWGLDLLAGEGRGALRRVRQAAVFLLFGVWAFVSLRTYWIAPRASWIAPRASWIAPGARLDATASVAAAFDPRGLLARAEEARRAGDPATAAALCAQETALSPDHPFAWKGLAAARAAAGDESGAIEALREALRITPADPGTHAALARLYARAGRTAQAQAHQTWAARLAAPPGAGRSRSGTR